MSTISPRKSTTTIIIILVTFVIELVLASSKTTTTSNAENPLYEQMSAQRRHVALTLKSWRIQQSAIPKSRIPKASNCYQSKKKNPIGRGFKFTFSRPTKERISQWFGVDEDANEVQLGMLRKQFNHDLVGMTNPCLHYGQSTTSSCKEDISFTLPASSVKSTSSTERSGDDSIVPASSQQQSSACWWPSFSMNPKEKKNWRILTYRQRIGHGVECYKRVRDAVLDWEFQNGDGSTGLLNVPPAGLLPARSTSKKMPHPYVARSRYSVSPVMEDEDSATTDASSDGSAMSFHRGIGSARRMVSFASSRFPLLPALYAVNPVMVVYDLVDQRGPGTTFSSTAYATMKGHLFRGEERVTVALRDYDESVDVEVVSISRPAPTMFARGLWPFIGNKQNAFFELQMNFLKGVAERKDINDKHGSSFLPVAIGRDCHLGQYDRINSNRLDVEF